MKRTGQHPDRALTALKVNSLKDPGRYADGNGLYLVVDPTGAKRWILRTTVKRKRCDIGLGGLRDVPLAEAREKARELRKIVKAGGDPLAERRSQASIPTFAQASAIVYDQNRTTWKNRKHSAQWITTLERYAFPKIGGLRVDQIESPDILAVLSPIWQTKPETAARIKQRMKTVFDWAKAAGHRTGENPVAGVVKGLPKRPNQERHHAALPFEEVPSFITRLDASDASTPVKLAFEFMILTATRTNEVLGLAWDEIVDDIWTLPAKRTKPKRELRIPLGPRCLEILRLAKNLSARGPYVFPGLRPGNPLSNMAFLMVLRRMGLESKVTGHGFRSTFTDWAHETTNFPGLVVEMALNHVIKDKTEAAYRRGDLFEKRRQLMIAWENFVTAGSPG